jgi:GR25 family glycosyltransferase involved in LPS biosynthesis
MKVDKIYVIALDHSDEKFTDIKNRLSELNIPGIPYLITNAFDGRVNPTPNGINLYEGWNLLGHSNDWWNREILPGEIGCSVSHINVWRDIVNNGHQRVLVLEEDFKTIKPLYELSDEDLETLDWDFCYLGRNKISKDATEESITEKIVNPSASYNSHAYLLTLEGAQKLIEGGIQQNLIPLDEYLTAMFGKETRNDLKKLYKQNLKAIAVKEDMVKQTSTPETSTIGHGNPTEEYFEILDTSDWDAWCSKYINQTIRKGEWDLIVDEIRDTNILEFPLFTPKFCREVIALADAKDKWTIDRHEFYPTNDVLLPEIGLNEIYDRVIHEIVRPLCIYWWHLEGKGWNRLQNENFMARYTMDRQSHLSLHHDFSHVTMVVKLNDEFDGGGTWFPKYRVLSNPEMVGTATLHPGMITHQHGARPITAGKRYIVVSFMRQT